MCMRSFRWGNTRSGTASQPGLNSAGRQQPCQHPALHLAPCALLCPANQLAASGPSSSVRRNPISLNYKPRTMRRTLV